MRHRHASSNLKYVTAVARQEVIAKSKICKGKPRVRSVTVESPDEQDDHFMVYSTHTVDALKNIGIIVRAL